jgi:pimeloyl-ACP methyl ester carboxylesterase
MATFVLVHGAWLGGWVWRPVAAALRSVGHEVSTPTLTGLGERAHLAHPAIDLDTHTQDILGVLEYEDLRDVVLVGHSYAGMVITAVAEQRPERLVHLVYLDAAVPQDGESALSLARPALASAIERIAGRRGGGWRVPPARPHPPNMTDHPLRSATQPIRIANPAALAIGRTFIYCTGRADKGMFGDVVDVSAQRARDAGWGYRELVAGHVAMETAPQELAGLLLDIAVGRPELQAV